jgi:hypothetical protein
MPNKRLVKFENIYLAKIVGYDRTSVLFEINELEPNYEEFRLVKTESDWAYDLISYKRYKILNVNNGIIDSEDLDKIKPDICYVYDVCSFIDVWNYMKEVFNIKEDLDTFLNNCLQDITELNRLLSPIDHVIDLEKVKMITNKRK